MIGDDAEGRVGCEIGTWIARRQSNSRNSKVDVAIHTRLRLVGGVLAETGTRTVAAESRIGSLTACQIL